ncbi:MAG: hypothetical protein NTV01_20375 [Bacteroidia bacterium]|nr:hypothetical protein [Bacteroidia bacterium]
MKKNNEISIYFLTLIGAFLILTNSCKKDDNPALPVLTTSAVSNITTTTANSGGNITSDGKATVTARGVCWSTSPSPVVTGSRTTDGTGTGIFASNITGLTANTTYYVRAYATNSAGTGYGSDITFMTTAIVLPAVTTNEATAITQTTATSGGNITSDGAATVSARGVCWSTIPSPIATGNHTTDGTGTGIFASNITGLTANSTYYARAYATNSAGTGYGPDITFMTTPVVLPSVTTTEATAITPTTATSGGDVTSDGGGSVIARGVCWNISQNPTISNSRSTNGIGTGSFTSNIIRLSPSTIYYVKAYATNSAGTSYGGEISFITALNTVQYRLDNGETPKHIFDSGIPLDSLYGKTWRGGLIFYLNTATGNGLLAAEQIRGTIGVLLRSMQESHLHRVSPMAAYENY